jgi:peptidoglycan/LPS O-acetylase OafA/YrhL
MSEPKRIDGLDFLRGIASFGVCWFHLTRFHYPSADGPFYHLVKASGVYGWLGVEVFFVISGFVIPYSLYRARYELKNYRTFILKRVIRLDPPYLVSIAVMLALAYALALYSGRTAMVEGGAISLTRVLLHLGYLNMFFNQPWLNPAFWTLAIEFQYYLIMGLIFPFVRSRSRWVRIAFLICFGLPAFFYHPTLMTGGAPYSRFIFQFAFLFVMGIVSFQRWVELIGRREYLVTICLATAGAFFTSGWAPALAGVFAVVCINFYNHKNLVSAFFGNISYSLYLLHWPIGHLTLSVIGSKFVGAQSDTARTAMLILTLGVCLLCSYLLYWLVERPAQQWSARIKYGRAKRPAIVEEVSGIAPATPTNAGI